MTTDIETPFQTYVISGTGPYALPWAYDTGDVTAVLVAAGMETLLSAGITITPDTTTTGGSLFLSSTLATSYAGKTLRITRATPIEQGWAAERGEREVGMEVSLDTLARALQDAAARDKALRTDLGAVVSLAGYEAALNAVATTAGLTVLELTGNGATVAYTLPTAPSSKNAVEVVVEGATQIQRDFTLAGAILTLAEPVPTGVRFDVKIRMEFPLAYAYVRADAVQMEPGNFLGRTVYNFATRAAFVATALTPDVGAICECAGLTYRFKGSTTAISDLPGWVPATSVTPEHWGADNTGVTSASVNINAAIDYLTTLGGGQLSFKGTYLLTVKTTLSSRVRMVADGSATLVRGANSFTMIALEGGNYDGVDYAELSGFVIDGRNDIYTSGGCVSVRGTFNRIIENYIKNSCGHGIGLSGNLGGTYVASGTLATITLNNAYTLVNGATVSLQFAGAVPDGDYVITSIISTTIFTVTLPGSYTESGLAANLKTCDTRDNLVRGNRITKANQIGISQHTAPRNSLVRNHIQDCIAEGITIDNASYRCLCDGNSLIDNASPGGNGGLGTGDGDMSRIVNNIIDMTNSTGTNKPCITFGGAADTTVGTIVAGNVLIGSPKAAIWLHRDPLALPGDAGYWPTKNIVIADNMVLNCAAQVLIDQDCEFITVKGNQGGNTASRKVVDLGVNNEIDGNFTLASPPHFSYTGAATITAANLRKTQRYNSGAGANLQLPTGANLDAEFTEVGIDRGFEFAVICVSGGAATMTVNTGVTITGNPIVAAGASVLWRLTKTATATWVAYRMAG